jgi:type IV pilus assembly protein PilY1
VDKSATTKAAAITGGLFATLGSSGAADARRFFTSPDLALVRCQGARWLNVAIGSGNRELPITDKTTQNRFYSLRDKFVLNPINWGTFTVIKDQKVDVSSSVIDVTPTVSAGVISQAAVPTTASGWQLDLAVAAGDAGEKVISDSRTFENTIFATSFVPKIRTDNNVVCTEAIGYNYLYVVSACNGTANPQFLTQTALPVVAAGLAGQLNQKGIAPEVSFLFPSPDNSPGSGTRRPPPVCLVGAESCGQFSGYQPKRTFWQQKGAD